MRRTRHIILLCIFFAGSARCQFSFDSVFTKHPLLKKIAEQPDKYHLQTILTEIDSSSGKPVFTDYFFPKDTPSYFYCASLVKLPVSILALQKLNQIGVQQDAIFITDSASGCQRRITRDTSSHNNYPSVEHYIKKMLLVSDNAAYSRVFEFLGVDYIHEALAEYGYRDVRIVNRYNGNCAGKDQLITNPVFFMDSQLRVVYRQEQASPNRAYTPTTDKAKAGKAFYNHKNQLIHKPKDFSTSNYLSLKDCHSILQKLIFPAANPFQVSAEQRNFLLRYLSYYPRQSFSPVYNQKAYPDNYKKYLFYGDAKSAIQDTNLIITNIVGQSYGFMSDCALFSDRKHKIYFMLSAAIYANADEVLNDGKYDYKTIALPFMAELGRQIYSYELRKNTKKEN